MLGGGLTKQTTTAKMRVGYINAHKWLKTVIDYGIGLASAHLWSRRAVESRGEAGRTTGENHYKDPFELV